MIGTSPAMERLRSEIDMVASSDFSVLILGETGVGKELVASAIHAASSRRSEPLISFNCANLSDSLAESQLFGHRRGAFTGATEHRIGLFEVADKGTVFLDEVGEIPLAIQAKLLRVLQNGQIQRMGDIEPRKVDVRIVAATNRDLKKEVAEGRFREDLFYRLSVYPIVVPPLRDRRTDIPLIAGHFLDREARRLGLRSLRLNHEAREAILQQSWQGNIRELEHVIMRAALRTGRRDREEVVLLEDLELGLPTRAVAVGPISQSTYPTHRSLREQQDEFTRKVLLDALTRHHGNVSAAGRELEQAPSNLLRIARRLDLCLK